MVSTEVRAREPSVVVSLQFEKLHFSFVSSEKKSEVTYSVSLIREGGRPIV